MEDGGEVVRVEVCANCGRGSKVEGMDYVVDGVVYCGRNCYWSIMLDASNARLRKHTRNAANAAARRAALKRTTTTAGGGTVAAKNTEDGVRNVHMSAQQQLHLGKVVACETMKDYGHAIYQMDSGLPTESSLSSNRRRSAVPNMAA
mmetsp:Transcript_11466/g.24755  ORF Transcript_11466/g.24755 Transcript_11466/m.24755 type:complete len:147 (+) Transcript_11466:192-632(+)